MSTDPNNPYTPPTSPPGKVGIPPGEKPGKVQAIAIMTLVGGILAVVLGASLLLGLATTCIGLLWPGPYFSIVLGIMAIVKGSKLLGREDYLETAPRTIAIMQIINVINCDTINVVLGILTLVFLSDPEVDTYYQG